MAWARTGVFAKILDKSIEVTINKLGEPQSFFSDISSAKALQSSVARILQIELKEGLKKGL